MEWDSPWGRGAPGWHLECSVMSQQVSRRAVRHPHRRDRPPRDPPSQRDRAEPGVLRLRRHRRDTLDAQQLPRRARRQDVEIVGRVPDAAGAGRSRLPPARLPADVPAGALPVSELEFSWENLAAALTRLKRLVHGGRRRCARDRPQRRRRQARPPYRERLDAAVSDDLNTAKALPVLDELLADKRLAAARPARGARRFRRGARARPARRCTRADLRVRPAAAAIDEADDRRAPRRTPRGARGQGLRPLRRDPRRTRGRGRRGDGRRPARLGLEADGLSPPPSPRPCAGVHRRSGHPLDFGSIARTWRGPRHKAGVTRECTRRRGIACPMKAVLPAARPPAARTAPARRTSTSTWFTTPAEAQGERSPRRRSPGST